MKFVCPHCESGIEPEYPDVIHAGYSNLGFIYCDQCGDVLTWSAFDPFYVAIVGDVHPWMLDTDGKAKVEESLLGCSCGGRYFFDAAPRCQRCHNPIPDILPDRFTFVVLSNRVHGEKGDVAIWKTGGQGDR